MIDRTDIKSWLESRITQEVLDLMVQYFDHQKFLMGVEKGTSVDHAKGRAEVLDFCYNRKKFMELVRVQENASN